MMSNIRLQHYDIYTPVSSSFDFASQIYSTADIILHCLSGSCCMCMDWSMDNDVKGRVHL